MIYTGPAGNALRTGFEASPLRSSRNISGFHPQAQGVLVTGLSVNWADPLPAAFDIDDYAYESIPAGHHAMMAKWIIGATPEEETLSGWENHYGAQLRALACPAFYYAPGVPSSNPQVQSRIKIIGPCWGTHVTFPLASLVLPSFPLTFGDAMWFEQASDDICPGDDMPTPIAAQLISLGTGETFEFTPDYATIDSGNRDTPASWEVFRFSKRPQDFSWYPL